MTWVWLVQTPQPTAQSRVSTAQTLACTSQSWVVTDQIEQETAQNPLPRPEELPPTDRPENGASQEAVNTVQATSSDPRRSVPTVREPIDSHQIGATPRDENIAACAYKSPQATADHTTPTAA